MRKIIFFVSFGIIIIALLCIVFELKKPEEPCNPYDDCGGYEAMSDPYPTHP
ncbi:MAG: hypothetical protein WC459_02290 [Patescibacteria group bacterium]